MTSVSVPDVLLTWIFTSLLNPSLYDICVNVDLFVEVAIRTRLYEAIGRVKGDQSAASVLAVPLSHWSTEFKYYHYIKTPKTCTNVESVISRAKYTLPYNIPTLVAPDPTYTAKYANLVRLSKANRNVIFLFATSFEFACRFRHWNQPLDAHIY